MLKEAARLTDRSPIDVPIGSRDSISASDAHLCEIS